MIYFYESQPEELVLRAMPRRYGAIARAVELSMTHHAKPCLGNGCDARPCSRHARTGEVVARYLRLEKSVHTEATTGGGE